MAGFPKSFSVSEAAALCGVGRTTIGYWIRSKKLHATRVGRNYTIQLEDLLFFLKNSGHKIPASLQTENFGGPFFKSFRNCWQYFKGSQHGLKCPTCIVYKNRLEPCFTIKQSGVLGDLDCGACPYYLETYQHRIQFIHQLDRPAAVFSGLYLWGGNSLCAEICGVQPKALVGMGIEKLVHTDSLPLVIETIKNLAFDEGEVKQSCRISIIKGQVDSKQMRVSVYPLREPAMTFLVLGVH